MGKRGEAMGDPRLVRGSPAVLEPLITLFFGLY